MAKSVSLELRGSHHCLALLCFRAVDAKPLFYTHQGSRTRATITVNPDTSK